MIQWIIRLLFRIRGTGLENMAGRLVAANRISRWDWMLIAPVLGRGSWIILPDKELPNPFLQSLWRGILFFAEEQVDPQQVIQHVRQGKTAVYFPEPLSPSGGHFRKISQTFDGDCPRAVLAVMGSPFHPDATSPCYRKRFYFPPIRLSVVLLDPNLPGLHGPRQLRDALGRAMVTSHTLGETVWGALLQSARLHGHGKIILDDENGQQLNYKKLIFKAILLSRLLESRTAPGKTVGILLPTTVGAVVTFFALQVGGRIPTILNFSSGPDTVLTTCQTAQVRLILTSRLFIQKARLQPVLDALADLEILYLEDLKPAVTPRMLFHAWWFSHFPHQAAQPVGGHAPAVVLFTSGSEGKPKGIVLSHSNLLANVAQVFTRLQLSPHDVILNVLPMFHAFGLTMTTLAPLLAGMRVFCHPATLDYRAIPKIAWKIRATVMVGTDTFLKGYGRMAEPEDFASLRYCFAGAEPLRPATQTLWIEKFGIRILEGYGATETAPVLAVNAPEACRSGSVGTLLPGITWKLEPVAGVEIGGRLLVHGPNIMLGTMLENAPGTVVPPQVNNHPGWYDTGDVVRVDDDGFVWIIGRAKRFAKIGGEMVSLAQVEAVALDEWPESLHGVVAIANAQKGEALVMVTTEKNANRQSFSKILQIRGLSMLLLPTRFIYHDTLPLLASGKLDLVTLQQWAQEGENNITMENTA
ncbi:MAG: AMP-binding protein [Magnetococcales bacterium]|nr:AMP-binding protein [Magnetococcales bacterium]